MSKNMKLNAGQKHILRLIARDAKADGWTGCSNLLYPLFLKEIPSELAQFEEFDGKKHARLTDNGQKVIYAMQWLI